MEEVKGRNKVEKVKKTFLNVYPTVDDFLSEYQKNHFVIEGVSNQELTDVYYSLMSEYMESEFKYRYSIDMIHLALFRTLRDQYPAYKKRLEIQKKIFDLTMEDILSGGIFINSGMDNTDSNNIDPLNTELPYTRTKSLQKRQYSQIDALGRNYASIISGLTADFIESFRDLFIRFIVGSREYLPFTEDELKGF